VFLIKEKSLKFTINTIITIITIFRTLYNFFVQNTSVTLFFAAPVVEYFRRGHSTTSARIVPLFFAGGNYRLMP